MNSEKDVEIKKDHGSAPIVLKAGKTLETVIGNSLGVR
ncbi:hypothetical protein CCP2SC5_40006 [Azospirillaceae bacterium]